MKMGLGRLGQVVLGQTLACDKVLSVVVMVAFLLGCTSAVQSQWVAYNDFAWADPDYHGFAAPGWEVFGDQGTVEQDPDYRIVPGDETSQLAKVTLFTDSNYPNTSSGTFVDYVSQVYFNPVYAPDPAVEPPFYHPGIDREQAREGYLRNYATGAALPVRAGVENTGTSYTWSRRQGATVAEVPGSPAYSEFFDQTTGHPIIGLWGTADGDDPNSVHTVTLSNLDPNKSYEYTTFGNFGHWRDGRNGVQWRWTKIEGHDPSGFQNLSSVDTDYATAINIDAGDPNDPRHSVGHEQRAVIRSVTDPSHYVTDSGEIWFDGWVTKFHFKPGADGEVAIVTRGINNAASMEFADVDPAVVDQPFSTDTNGVPVWVRFPKLVEYQNPNGDPILHPATSRAVDKLVNATVTNPADPLFGANYADGWKASSDPSKWPANPDALEATVGQSVDNGDPANSAWYLAGFKLEELVLVTGLPGDYNENDQVDAADYAIWRDHVGQTFDLPNRDENNSGPVNQADYNFWRSNFGNVAVGAGSGAVAVPEPSVGAMVLLFSALAWSARRR